MQPLGLKHNNQFIYLILSVYFQISVYAKQSDNETVPAFASIFRDSDTEESGDESEADSGDEESENRAEDRVRRFERRLEKRRERQRWKDDRNKILFDYTQFSFYGQSSAQIFFELAWKMSKDSLDILWWSLVGITEQFVLGKIAKAAYAIQATEMQSHVSRLMSRTTQGNSSQTSIQILFENDLQFALYRHWSIQESLKHSIIPSCKLRLWTVWGEKRLHELLVEMGLPLVQSRQVFTSMDLELKKEFLEMIEKCAEKYDLMEVIYSSFTLQYGYRNKYSAADYVYSMLAILESVKRNRSPEYCFLEALDSLTRTNRELLESGIEWSKKLLQATYRQVTTSLDTHQILTAGPYLYVILNEEESYFSCPHGLLMLAKFILKAHVSISRNRRAPEMPLVACSPIDITEGIYLLIGIPPVCEFSLKSFFGKAFEQAAIKSKATVVADSFDPTVIQIKQSDLVRFLDALTVLLS